MEVGLGRTRDRALGCAAVMRAALRHLERNRASALLQQLVRTRCIRAYVAALAMSVLAGCAAVGGFAGAAAAFATSVATTNPGLGLAVGISVKAATDDVMKTLSRRRQQAQQDIIAAAASDMQAGDSRDWHRAHLVGSGSDRGEVRVVRLIETSLARCKEIVFSVIDDEDENAKAAWFTTTACQQGSVWKWAAAEPAVERWGNLQ